MKNIKRDLFPIFIGLTFCLSILLEEYLFKELWIFGTLITGFLVIGFIIVLIYSIIKKRKRLILINCIFILIASSSSIVNWEIFKSKKQLEAILIDDLSSLTLILRENKVFEVQPNTWMGPTDSFKGNYKIQGNRIIFIDEPYDSDFIPDTVLIYQDKILLKGTEQKPDTSFANYFQIRMNELNNDAR
ncbi:hypothetical protein [Marinifilum breve]|nr:hypothetical protein [Marinifilum breve]